MSEGLFVEPSLALARGPPSLLGRCSQARGHLESRCGRRGCRGWALRCPSPVPTPCPMGRRRCSLCARMRQRQCRGEAGEGRDAHGGFPTGGGLGGPQFRWVWVYNSKNRAALAVRWACRAPLSSLRAFTPAAPTAGRPAGQSAPLDPGERLEQEEAEPRPVRQLDGVQGSTPDPQVACPLRPQAVCGNGGAPPLWTLLPHP